MTLNGIAIIFVIANVFALLFLPRRWAPMPLLIGACYMTLNSGIEIGPTHFSIIRILVAAGLLRVMMRGERLAGGMNGLDRIMLIWSVWALLSSTFHKDPSAALMFRFGLVYNACGIYFLIRIFCQSLDDVAALCRITAVLMVPLAIEMLFENGTSHNLFSMLGGVSETPAIREGKVRAQGPFAHAILAGTAGAVTLPIIIGIWSQHRKNAVIGVLACVSIVLASASSGPMMSAMAAVIALCIFGLLVLYSASTDFSLLTYGSAFYIFNKQLLGPLIIFQNNFSHFLINPLSGFLTVITVLGNLPAQKDLLFLFAKGEGAQFLTHAPIADHFTGKVC